MNRSDFHVVGGFDNPRRFKTPPALTRKWATDSLDSGATVYLVEHSSGNRPFEFSQDEPCFKHVKLMQIRSAGPEHELWLQHALFNYGIGRMPETARKICWQDTDVRHLKGDYVDDALHMLDSHTVGQTWTHAIDLDPSGNIAKNDWDSEVDRSFSAAFVCGQVDIGCGPYIKQPARALLSPDAQWDTRCHTGFSWSIRRDALTGRRGGIGKLLDWMIIGSGDWHMAAAFCGNLRQKVVDWQREQVGEWAYAPGYYRRLLEFADLCETHIRQDVGCVSGILEHGWHGSKHLRMYGGREDVMRESKMDPDTDIVFDINGLPTLCSDNRLLRDGIRRYNRRRNSDSIDLYTRASAPK